MVCTSNELLGWKDFPKGLRVLLLDEDLNSASEIRSKLEEMDYIVSLFCNEDEALSAISSKSQIFHIAIVEASTGNSQGSFTFLKNVKNLPTIMTSNVHCLSTMMKCIAQGAVEFLHKPLSEDKLRNVWQHVVHKAFNAGGSNLAESLKPVKESVSSILQLQLEHKEESRNQSRVSETINDTSANKSSIEQSSASNKCPAPLTPQLIHVGKLLDFPTEKDSVEQDVGESKSVETTCENSLADFSSHMSPPQISNETVVKKEDGSKSESNISPSPQKKNGGSGTNGDTRNERKVSNIHNSRETRSKRNKMKVDWTPELHKKFVKAVEQLSVDQAIPSRILELMEVHGLTRHNVASHLQKYRMHRRHILPKEGDRRLLHPRDAMERGYYQNKPPVMAYPVWGPSGGQLPAPGVQMWGQPGFSTWQPADSWHWKPYQTMYADAWGYPVMPPPQPPYYSFPQNAVEYQNMSGVDNGCCTTPNSFYLHQEEEIIEKIVKEAISKPWLPLPLGLKPPSTESVLAELCKQGIPKIPPQTY